MKHKPILTILAILIACAFIGISFSSTVQAKFLTSDKIKERSTTELLSLEYFEDAQNMYETSYFTENGFNFYNPGYTYLDLQEAESGEFTYNTMGWTGHSDDPYVVGDTFIDTPHDKRAIAMKCAEVDSKGDLTSAGGFLGKSMSTMCKQYPTFVTLPDSNYFYNITVKLADVENLNDEDDSNYYMDMYIPSLSIIWVACDIDDILWAAENENFDNLSTKGLSVTFMRGTQQETSDIHSSKLNNYLFTYSEWEIKEGVETESYTETEELSHFSNDAWITMCMSFKEIAGKWHARYELNASSFKDTNITGMPCFEQEIHIFDSTNTLPILNYFGNYYYHYDKDMQKEQWDLWALLTGILWVIISILLAICACIAAPSVVGTIALGAVACVAWGLAAYYFGNVVTYNVPIEGVVEKTRLLFHEAKEFFQGIIATILMQPSPTMELVNFIDELSVEYGNHPPEARFGMYDVINNTATAGTKWWNHGKPIIPFDRVNFIDSANSVDYDGNDPLSTRFYTYFDDEEKWQHEYMNTSDPEISYFNELGGVGSIQVDPQLHSTITTHLNYTVENITYAKVWKYSRVDIETRSITYDSLMGCSLCHEDEYKEASFGFGTVTGAVFDTNGTLIDFDELVEVGWPIITADMTNRNAKYVIGDPPLFFDASQTEYIIDINTGTPQKICDNLSLIDEHGLVFRWNLGDGTKVSGLNATHKYTHEGIYSVTLTVTDKYGNTDDIKGQVVVYETQIFIYPPTGWFEQLPSWFWYALFGVIAAGSIGAIAMYYTGESGGAFVQIIQPTTRPEYRERRPRRTVSRKRKRKEEEY